MRCPNCDNEIPEGKQFCGHCGHRLAPAEPAATPEFDEEAPTRIAPAELEEPPPEPEAEAEPPPPPPGPEPEPPVEVEAAPAVEEPSPEKEAWEPQPPAVVDRSWLFAWLSTLGWALGFALLSPIDTRIFEAIYQSGGQLGLFARAAIVRSITVIVSGLLTGIGLRRAVPGVKRWHVFLITLGWAASLVLSSPTSHSNMELSYWALCGSALGLVAGLISWRRGVSPWWKQTLKVLGFVVGTGLAWILAEAILNETFWSPLRVPFLYLAEPVGLIVGGATGGLLTGLVWRLVAPSVHGKQVLIVTVGWAVGLLLGSLVVLVDMLTLTQQFRSGLDYTLIGVIGGAVGSGVMAWQLRRVNTAG